MCNVIVRNNFNLDTVYENLDEAVNYSDPGDIILIVNPITIYHPIKIDHDLIIDAAGNSINIVDNTFGLMVGTCNLEIKNASIIYGPLSNAIVNDVNSSFKLKLDNVKIKPYELYSSNQYYSSIYMNKDCNNVILELHNSYIDTINGNSMNRLVIDKSILGNIITMQSNISSNMVQVRNSQISNVYIKSPKNPVDMNNVSTLGNLNINGSLLLNNFSVSPLSSNISEQLLDKSINTYALIIHNDTNTTNNIQIKNTNLDSDNLANQNDHFFVTSWFNFSNCHITFINSNILENLNNSYFNYSLNSDIKLVNSNIVKNWVNKNTGISMNNKHFNDLKSAIDLSTSGDTVYMYEDSYIDQNVGIYHNLVINGNGKNIHISKDIAGLMINKGNIQINDLNVIIENKSNFINKNKVGDVALSLNNVNIRHTKLDRNDFYPSIYSMNDDNINDQSNINLYINNSKIDYIAVNPIDNILISSNSIIGSPVTNDSIICAKTIDVKDSQLNNVRIISKNYENTISMENISTIGNLSIDGSITINGFMVDSISSYIVDEDYSSIIKRFNINAEVYALNIESNKRGESIVDIKNAVVNAGSLANFIYVYCIKAWFNFSNSNVSIIDSNIGKTISTSNVSEYSDVKYINSVNNDKWKIIKYESISNQGSNIDATNSSNDSIDDKKTNKFSSNALRQINELIGLKSVKSQLNKFIKLTAVNKAREEDGMKSNSHNMNMVFEGNPGTGKTVVARLFAKALYETGVLKKENFVEITAKDLMGNGLGDTQKTVESTINKALDGLLFIDEAYILAPVGTSNDMVKNEAVTELVDNIENNRDRLVVIMAGYTSEMEDFLDNGNPGLKSRFPNKIIFPDYNEKELLQIFNFQLKKSSKDHNGNYIARNCTPKAMKIVEDSIERLYETKKINGNARFIRDQIMNNLLETNAERIYPYINKPNISKDFLNTFEEVDAKKSMSRLLDSMGVSNDYDEKKEFNNNSSESAINKLNSLIGLEPVKKKADQIIRSAKLNKIKKANNMDSISKSNNILFEGNPGTGKTIVARLFANALFEEGVLKTNNIVEVKSGELVGEFVGHTAVKTKKVIKSALDGVLFIDEAYQLAPDHNKLGNNNFKDEAVTELISDIENNRDRLVVIMAGYTSEMEDFLNNGNPGLKSRFPNKIIFPDYSSNELFEILKYTIKKNKLICTNESLEVLKHCINECSDNNRINGNGRFIRNMFEKLIDYQSYRVFETLSNIDKENILSDEQKEQLVTINSEDAKKTAKDITNNGGLI